MRFAPILFFMEFATKLLAWYPDYKRDLPWRHTKNPYHIWLSEIILQQTRVKQGLPYYEAFVTLFPTVQELAYASEESVMRTWQGLGYYSRARNMHATAQYITQELQGIFPQNYQDLLKLKGVGTYTAAAIASFAFEERVAVVDGNVFRVLARYFGMQDDIASPQGIKKFQALAQSLLPQAEVSTYNQAIMEFGALQCTPQKPNCMFCPLQASCVAYLTQQQDKLPVKTNKIKQKERFFHYIIMRSAGKLAMRKREVGDIWTGLYDFALQEDKQTISIEDHPVFAELQNFNHKFAITKETNYFKHQLTHQTLHIKFWILDTEDEQILTCLPSYQLQWYDQEAVHDLPKPIVIANFIEKME